MLSVQTWSILGHKIKTFPVDKEGGGASNLDSTNQ